jgi:hypothetical protein
LTCKQIYLHESEDSSLTGYTVICGKNNGPDELVFCLEPIENTGQALANENDLNDNLNTRAQDKSYSGDIKIKEDFK